MSHRDLTSCLGSVVRKGDARLARAGTAPVSAAARASGGSTLAGWGAVLLAALLGASGAEAAEPGAKCTIIADPRLDAILYREGDCAERFSPASTFKVALALIGFDSGLLRDNHNPAVDFVPGTRALKRDQKRVDPTIWQRDSIVWYSRYLTAKLGMQRLSAFVSRLGYGNADVSGDPGLSNGLTQAWLGSSLQISPDEQAQFLVRMVDHRLPVSEDAVLQTERIVPQAEAADGWLVHGKTGSVIPRTGVSKPRNGVTQGWFVGWADRGGRRVVFVRFQEMPLNPGRSAGAAVQETMLAALPGFIP